MAKPIIRVQDVMHNQVFSIDGMASVKEAVAMMRTSRVAELLVTKRNEDDAWGIITISDVVKQIVVPGRDAEEMQVYEIMTKPAVTVPAEMDIRYAIRLMQRIGVHRAPVQLGKEIVGMVTLSGIILDSDLI